MDIARKLHAARKTEAFASLGIVKALILAGLATGAAAGSRYPVIIYAALSLAYLLNRACSDLGERRAGLWTIFLYAGLFALLVAYHAPRT